ncbi:MAG TPA: AAA family ATPase [Coleofasciculaceae cyanobacterium]|jgi:capsular exopolysaccharide synthesis family protein
MNSNFENQKTYYLQNSSALESTEGGLNLGEVTNTLMRKLPLIASITIAMTSLAFFKTLLFPPVYVASFELLPETVNVETKVTSTNEKSGETREEITLVELDDVQLKILKSPQVISRAVDSLQGKYPQLDYQTLSSGLTVDFIRDSQNKKNVLSVSYKHSDKQQVSEVIDVLTQTYLDYSAQKRSSGVKRGITVLERQIVIIASQVDQLENQLQNLRNKYNFVEPEVSLNPITNRSSLIAQEQDQVASELQQMRLKLKNLDRELQIEPTTSPTAIDLATPRYLGLLNQLRETDVAISRKSTVFSDRTAEMQVLNEERQRIVGLIEQTGAAIRQKLENEIRTLENRQKLAQSESSKLRSQLKTWSTVSNDYNKLQQKLTLAKNQLDEFTLQRDALLIDAAQQQAPWQLLAPAGEPYNNDLDTSNRLLLGSSFGLLLGIGIALMLDKYQKVIYTSAKVEEITSLPVLGNIPYTSKKRQLSLLDQAKNAQDLKRLPSSDLYRDPEERELFFPEFSSPSIEAFRSFAANLGLLNFDTNLKSLAITSAVSGEGKSTVALNLARAAASMGKRVLLVDADVRSNVRLTESLGLESEIGLKNILNQNSASFALKQIKKSPLEDNLYILTSGFDELMNRDSSRLFASGQMHLLMEELKSNYDLIIYDLCAVVGYADVNLLAAKTDGLVMVTGLGKIDKTLLSQAIEQLKMCNVPILGIAVNNLVN